MTCDVFIIITLVVLAFLTVPAVLILLVLDRSHPRPLNDEQPLGRGFEVLPVDQDAPAAPDSRDTNLKDATHG